MAGNRVARNVYFWAALIFTRLDYKYTPVSAICSALLFVLLMALCYTNSLLLVPRLFSKKRYAPYLLLYAVLVLVIAVAYTGVLKWMLHTNPGITVGMVSPLTFDSVSGKLSAGSLLEEMLPYYGILFIVGCIFAMSWYVNNYQRLQHRLDLMDKKHLQTELQFLKNQINPHFLFNTLNNLYTLTIKKSDEAPEVVAQLSAILRYLLYESDSMAVSSEKEKEIMQAYIDLEMLRITEKRNLHFEIETDRQYSIPPLLWVPVLENVFKHGTRFISDAHAVDFRFTIKDAQLNIHSKNTFRHPDTSRPQEAGIGLDNLRKRLQLLYPGRHQFSAGEDEHYYITALNVQLADGAH